MSRDPLNFEESGIHLRTKIPDPVPRAYLVAGLLVPLDDVVVARGADAAPVDVDRGRDLIDGARFFSRHQPGMLRGESREGVLQRGFTTTDNEATQFENPDSSRSRI
uniref:Pirin_C domain-containing protein n=1 Tax=Steinernema glaseri TaxID=37863 RepID=A0A1I7ZZF9_9BILA